LYLVRFVIPFFAVAQSGFLSPLSLCFNTIGTLTIATREANVELPPSFSIDNKLVTFFIVLLTDTKVGFSFGIKKQFIRKTYTKLTLPFYLNELI
jgi:hypothetical protein